MSVARFDSASCACAIWRVPSGADVASDGCVATLASSAYNADNDRRSGSYLRTGQSAIDSKICSNPPHSASSAASTVSRGVNGCAAYITSTTVLITPTSAVVVPSTNSIPAMNAHAVAVATDATLLCAVNPPSSTAIEHHTVDANIRFARFSYGSLPSEYETFSAPLAIANPPRGIPNNCPTTSGATTPSVFLSACATLNLLRSTCVTICHSACSGLIRAFSLLFSLL